MGNKDGSLRFTVGWAGRADKVMRVSVIMVMALLAFGASGAIAQNKVDGEGVVRGEVTNLPLPRYVSLKTNEGNARRGPGLTHRIDWVFSRAGMPLRITAEYENWRRIEDAEGAGGWVHYSLLSGTRTALVAADMLDLRATPLLESTVVLRAEAGVIARLLECRPDWCRLSIADEKGWAQKSVLWGVDPGESFD